MAAVFGRGRGEDDLSGPEGTGEAVELRRVEGTGIRDIDVLSRREY